MTENEILSTIKRLANENGLVCYDDLLQNINIPFLEKNLITMVNQGLLLRHLGKEYIWYGLTPHGHEKLEQLAQEHAEKKRDKAFNILLLFLGSALTLLVEHGAAIAKFIAGLFGKQ